MESLAHIAVATPSLDQALPQLEKILGVKASHAEEVKTEKVRVAFFEVGSTRIEILEPTEEQSPISGFLQKRGQGIHHLAFYVKDLDEKIEELRQKGIQFIGDTPKVGAENCRIIFIHPKSAAGILIELIERV